MRQGRAVGRPLQMKIPSFHSPASAIDVEICEGLPLPEYTAKLAGTDFISEESKELLTNPCERLLWPPEERPEHIPNANVHADQDEWNLVCRELVKRSLVGIIGLDKVVTDKNGNPILNGCFAITKKDKIPKGCK